MKKSFLKNDILKNGIPHLFQKKVVLTLLLIKMCFSLN